MTLPVNNNGGFGGMASLSGYRDYFTNEPVTDGEYLKGSGKTFIGFGGLWVGAVVGSDTLVSTCYNSPGRTLNGIDYPSTELFEFQPGTNPDASLRRLSSLDQDSGAISHDDLIAVFADTCVECFPGSTDWADARPHRPLGIEVTQRSFAWTYPWARDFVPVSYVIRNIGSNLLTGVYAGIYLDADVLEPFFAPSLYNDDLAGSHWASAPSTAGCLSGDSLFIGWVADNDGDNFSCDDAHAIANAFGITCLTATGEASLRSFNWWAASVDDDFGPRRRSTGSDPYRDFGTGGTGVPYGDRNKYYMLRHREYDFSQYLTKTIGVGDSAWAYIPNRVLATRIAKGSDIRILMSVGPWTLAPGQEASFTIAFIGGENLHTRCQSLDWSADNPSTFAASLAFTSLDSNALAARRTVDNPGVDTDSDGYAGAYILCAGETTWVSGDGVPDFAAAIAPTSPVITAVSSDSTIHLCWNGGPSELRADRVSGKLDFEKYTVWLKPDSAANFNEVASWDLDDFARLVFDADSGAWFTLPERYFADSLRCIYAPGGCADTSWNPSDFTQANPYQLPAYPDSVFAFTPIDDNLRLGETTIIHRRYPETHRPIYARPADVPADSIDFYLTHEGFFKYFEYEVILRGLAAGKTYKIAVTASDCGCPSVAEAPKQSPLSATVRQVSILNGSCCAGLAGNVNCDSAGSVDIADLSTLIDNLFLTMTPLCCTAESDCDGSAGVDIGDLSALIDYLFLSFTPLPACRIE